MRPHFARSGLIGPVLLALLMIGCTEMEQKPALESPELSASSQNANIAASAADVQPLLPGMEAAAFELPMADGSTYSFDPSEIEKPAVLVFYRGGWCPYCLRHLSALRPIEDDIEALGYELLFISADSPDVLAEGEDYDYTLISDDAMTAAQDYGIAFYVDDDTIERYREIGLVDLEAASPTGEAVLPAPAVFIVGTDGVIQFSYVNPNYRVRLHPDILMAAATVGVKSGS